MYLIQLYRPGRSGLNGSASFCKLTWYTEQEPKIHETRKERVEDSENPRSAKKREKLVHALRVDQNSRPPVARPLQRFAGLIPAMLTWRLLMYSSGVILLLLVKAVVYLHIVASQEALDLTAQEARFAKAGAAPPAAS